MKIEKEEFKITKIIILFIRNIRIYDELKKRRNNHGCYHDDKVGKISITYKIV